MRSAVLILCAWWPAFALDPAQRITEYAYSVWQTREGLAHGTIHAIAQTPSGYLWVGTDQGLVRFDGIDFVLFHAANTSGVVEGKVWDLHPTPHGDLLVVSTLGGVARLTKAGEFHRVADDRLNSVSARAVVETSDGAVWVGTFSAGLIRVAPDGSLTRLTAPHDLPSNRVKDLVQDSSGKLWVATYEGGAFQIKGMRAEPKPVVPGDIRNVHQDRAGNVWFASASAGVTRLNNSGLRTFTTRDGLSSNDVLVVLEDRDGNIWAGTEGGGLNRIRDGAVEVFGIANGLPSAGVRALFEDKEGNLWLGGDDGSLSQFRNAAARLYTSRDGLSGDSVRTVMETSDGSLWVGTATGLSRQKLHDRILPLQGALGKLAVSTVAEAGRAVWVGTAGQGLFRVIAGNVLPVAGLEREVVTSIEPAGPWVWVTTQGGAVHQIDSASGRIALSASGLSAATTVLARKQVWVGASTGLFRLTPEGRLSQEAGLPIRGVVSLLEEKAGGLWVGTNRGLFHFDGGRVRPAGGPVMETQYILQILESGDDLWLATTRGIYVARRNTLLTEHPEFEFIPAASSSGTGYHQPAGCRDRNGRFWFATVRGLLMVDPARIHRNRTPPPVRVEWLTADRRPVSMRESVELPADTWELAIKFAGLSFVDPQRMPVRYRLEGFDRDWVNATGKRSASYLNLPPGQYRFQVTAANSDGVWNDLGASIRIYKNPLFYQTWWFACLVALAVSGSAWLIHHRHVGLVKREYAAILADRSRIARELHDSIEQGLTGVCLQLESLAPRSPAVLKPSLQLAQQMVRHCLGEVRCAVMDLRPDALESGDLRTALEGVARQFNAAGEAQCAVRVEGTPRRLPAQMESHLFRIGQESITNAVRHAHASRIIVELRFGEDGTASLSITDNGCGMPADRKSDGPHFGLLGMKERANKMGAVLTIDSSPGAGTRVSVDIPGEAIPA